MEEYLNSSQFVLTLYFMLSYFAIWLIAWIVTIIGKNSSTRLESTVLSGYLAGVIFQFLSFITLLVIFVLQLEILQAVYYAVPVIIMLLIDLFFFLYLKRELKVIEIRG